MASRRDFFSRLYRTAGVAGGALLFGRAAGTPAEAAPGRRLDIQVATTVDPALRALLSSPVEGLGPDLIPRRIKRLSGVEELRSLTTATKVGWVWLNYHTAPGDGGGGPLLLDPSDSTLPDNHGTMFRSKAGDLWKRPNLLDVTAAQFGAQGLLTLDDALAIQRACDAVCPVLGQDNFPAGRVWLGVPRLGYLLQSTLNLTNTRADGTRGRDGLTLEGPGHFGVRLVGATGDGRAVIETTGTQWLTLRNLRIEAHVQNGSTVGIYQGIGRELPETQNQKLERIFIDLPDIARANNGTGTIGILNFGAEENTYECCYITANAPAIFTGEDFGYKHSYVKQLETHSLGMTTFIGENVLVARNARSPSLVTQDVDTFHAPSLYLANAGAGGSNKHAWQIRGGFVGGVVGGLIEGHSTAFKAYGRLQNASVHFVFGSMADADAARFELESGGEGMILESSLNFLDSMFPNRPLMVCKPSSLSQRVPCMIRNTDIRCTADKRYLAIQESVLGNPGTGNVSIEGLRDGVSPWRWEIGDHQQRVNIPPTTISASDGVTEAEVCRLVLPAAGGAAATFSAVVKISGLISSISRASGVIAGRQVEEVLYLTMNDQGELKSGTSVAKAEGSPMDSIPPPDAASSHASVNGLASAQLREDPLAGWHVSLVMVPDARDWTGNSLVFVGMAEMTWFGHGSMAPRLSCET